MKIRRLHQFNVLANTGSLHRAARELGLSQPALSQSIRMLEADVGVQLVNRSPTGTSLTEAGAIFREKIQAILTDLDQAFESTKRTANSFSSIRLGLSTNIISDRIENLLNYLIKGNNAESIVIIDNHPADLLNEIISGRIDFALITRSSADAGSDHSEEIWQEDVLLALPSYHSLASNIAIDLRQLAEQPLITVSREKPDAADESLLSSCRTVGIVPRIISSLQNREIELAMVAAGFGIAAIPAGIMGSRERGIVYRKTIPPLSISMTLAWSASQRISQVKHFLAQIRTQIIEENYRPSAHRAARE